MKKLANIMFATLVVFGVSGTAFAQPAADAPATEPAVDTAPDTTAPEPAAEPAPAPEEAAPAPAPAPEAPKAEVPAAPAEQPAAARLLSYTIEAVATLLMVLIGFAVRKVSKFFHEKTKIEIPAKTEDMISAWGEKAVGYAKEKAHQYVTEKGEKMKGPDKLEVALGFGLGLAEEYGLPNLAKDKLTKYIEAHLGTTRAEA